MWLPSQNGVSFVALQPQNQTVSSFSARQIIGLRPVPLCAPSQKGCVAERPQEHQKYFSPAFTSTP